ncbi:MAG: radical SAM protein [Lautropia sp.]
MLAPIRPSIAHSDLRSALERHRRFDPGQLAGRRWPIGCVSLEVTQRCNLDCSLCYLSDLSEAARDLPLAELIRRIDQIAERYGPDTDIQISGGDPTLRPLADLVAIVRHIRARGLRCSLFTNGILATRALLETLADAGLNDVAFHVDLTQQRKGFATEASLNRLRVEYLARARGLGLSVYFNTTVFAGNVGEVAMLARFFVAHADEIDFVSFQLQADTGRGVLRARADAITQARIEALIAEGVGVAPNFDSIRVGHPECNRFAMLFVAGGHAIDALAETRLVHRFVALTADLEATRGTPIRTATRFVARAATRGFLLDGLAWFARLAWRLRRGLPKAVMRMLLNGRAPVRKLSLMTHNFMDAKALDDERLACCVFMAASIDGPVPMCRYNAERDHWLSRPVPLADGTVWEPLAGRVPAIAQRSTGSGTGTGTPVSPAVAIPIKWLKGRARETALRARRRGIA